LGWTGLHIIIRPNGKKFWRLQFVLAGKKRLMGLGESPAVSLLAARKKPMICEASLPLVLIL